MRPQRRGITALWFVVVLSAVGLAALPLAAAPNWDVSEIDGDGIDNDGDGYIDSEDTECGSHYEGFGSISVGGSGGQVFWVDPALGDISAASDPHSGTHDDPCGIRKALDGSNRVVKFVAGGTITLNSDLRVYGSNVTIDGFSAPAPGITFTQTSATHATLLFAPYGGVAGHDYIVNHLRFDGLFDENQAHRVGWAVISTDGDVNGNSLSKMVFDHLTVRDLQDKFTLWGAVDSVTLSHCLFYRSVLATLVSFYSAPYDLLRTDISFHHNVWAENGERNPQLRGWIRNFDYVNNVIFHWGYFDGWGYGVRIKNEPGEESIYGNFVNNYFYTRWAQPNWALVYGWSPGPDYADIGPPTKLPQGTVYTGSDMGQLWVSGNILPSENVDEYSTIPGPIPIPQWAQVTTIPAAQLYTIVPDVGMRYKDSRDQGVIDRVLAEIGPDVQVVGRYVFYNNSAFDGNDPAANAADDGAIAPDKQPLFNGQVASFANYTSYSRGINGIMIDVDGLDVAPTAADFAFKVGNDSNPSSWATAPAPVSITVRDGAGVGGSDRITIIWADGAIKNQWLEVTVKASLGIPFDDVFYFGNAIGETGNSPTDAKVTPTDVVGCRNNPHTSQNPADITDVYDFDRDTEVGPTDAVICRTNGSNSMTALQLIVLVENQAPVVDAGADISIRLPQDASLDGTVSDDGYPDPPGQVTSTWSVQSGPGTVTFADASAVDTIAAFDTPGSYVLVLTADDGERIGTDQVNVTVNPPASSGAFQESGGQVVMEAENYDTNDARSDPTGEPYTFSNATPGYVGEGYVYPASEDANNSSWDNAAECTYEIDFATSGKYTIWLRRYCEDDGHNSCYVGIDGVQVGGTCDNTNSGFGSWYWHAHDTTVAITAGRHTFNLRRRERGYKVDRIVITKNGNTPTGNGPAESPRS